MEKLTVGEVELDSYKNSILELLGKFGVYEKLIVNEMKSESEQAACKICYNSCQENNEIDLDEDEKIKGIR